MCLADLARLLFFLLLTIKILLICLENGSSFISKKKDFCLYYWSKRGPVIVGGELDLSFIPVTTQLLNILFHSGVTNVLSYMSLSSGQVYIPPIWSSVLSAGKFRVVLHGLNLSKYGNIH